MNQHIGLFLISKIRSAGLSGPSHGSCEDETTSLDSSLVRTGFGLGRNHEPLARIPCLFSLQLHELLKIHTPFPFSVRGRAWVDILRDAPHFTDATRFTFSEFSSFVLLSGKRSVFSRDCFRFRETATLCHGTQLKYWDFSSFGSPFGESGEGDSFGIPKHFTSATRIRYSDFSYSCSPIPESNSPGTLAFLNALRGFPLTGVLFLCGFIIPYIFPVVKGVFAFSYMLYTKVMIIFYNFGQIIQ